VGRRCGEIALDQSEEEKMNPKGHGDSKNQSKRELPLTTRGGRGKKEPARGRKREKPLRHLRLDGVRKGGEEEGSGASKAAPPKPGWSEVEGGERKRGTAERRRERSEGETKKIGSVEGRL